MPALTGERWTLPPEPQAVRKARERVAAACHAWGVADDDLPMVLLVTSELVTNAVRHACTDLSVEVTNSRAGVRVSVGDHSTALPIAPEPDPTRPGGLGLVLVDRLSDDWGVNPGDDGKYVWAVVPVHQGPAQGGRGLA